MMIFAFSQKNVQTTLVAADVTGYDFKNGAVTGSSDSKYNNNASFIISNKAGLDNFAASVNNAGVDFSGKTVYLTKDIDYDRYYETNFKGIGVNPGSNMYDGQCFKGTFDGLNHTISYIQISQGRSFAYSEWHPYYIEDEMSIVGVGFFAALRGNAKVLNFRIKDARYLVTDWSLGLGMDRLGIGGIAGYIYGKPYTSESATNAQITNCSVENLTIENYGVSSSVTIGLVGANEGTDVARYIGGIAGLVDSSGKLTVSNCFVSGLKSYVHKKPYLMTHIVSGSNNYVNDMAGAFVGDIRNSNGITNCVFNESDSFCAYDSGTKYAFYYASGFYPWSKSAVGSAVYVFASGYGHGDSSFTSLNKNAIGGESSVAWYYAPTYNSYPILRQFISWRDVQITAVNGSVDVASIKIPMGATISNSYTTETINIFNRTINAKGDEYTEFEGWTYDSATSTFTAQYKFIYYRISFKKPEYEAHIKIVTNASSIGTEYSVAPGSDSDFSYSVVKFTNGTIKSITYSFVDIDGYDRTIKYEAIGDYYLDLIDDFKTNNISGDLLNITVAMIPKDYNLGII